MSGTHRIASKLPFGIDINRFRVAIGVLSIIIAIGAWTLDLTHMVYPCPFCRVQRTGIGLLGLVIIFLPHLNLFLARYVSLAVGGFSFVVGGMQHFTYGWQMMFQGTFKLHDPWIEDPWVLSACAMLILAGQIGVLLEADPEYKTEESRSEARITDPFPR